MIEPGKPSIEGTLRDRMRELYSRLDAELEPHRDLCRLRGVCCDFRTAGHALYATGVEVEHARQLRAESGRPIPTAEAPGLCPFWREGLCTARDERPIGCRVYFCDPSWKERGEALYEKYHREVTEIGREFGHDYTYGPFVELLAESEDSPPPAAEPRG